MATGVKHPAFYSIGLERESAIVLWLVATVVGAYQPRDYLKASVERRARYHRWPLYAPRTASVGRTTAGGGGVQFRPWVTSTSNKEPYIGRGI